MLETAPDWIGESGNIILHIDEVYFSVEFSGQAFKDAGLDWRLMEMLQAALGDMFCLRHIHHERRANHMMRKVVVNVLSLCHRSGSSGITCLVPVGVVSAAVRKVVFFYYRRDRGMFCPSRIAQLVETSNTLASILRVFESRQLHVLGDFAFCVSSTLGSINFYGDLTVRHSGDPPNSSYRHIPDSDQVETRTSRLQQILDLIDGCHTPSVVTLSRSVRHGHTPRCLFRSIESNILDIFEGIPGPYDVMYDENMYSGAGGWPSRHKMMQRTRNS